MLTMRCRDDKLATEEGDRNAEASVKQRRLVTTAKTQEFVDIVWPGVKPRSKSWVKKRLK